jgi:hypothetical protein
MVKRLFVGLFLGAVIGAIVAAVLVQGLHIAMFGAVTAYLSAVVTGVLTGFVAGKPIWSADGKIEAGLKAFFGGLLALGGMFVLRQWVHADLNLSSLNAGNGEIGWLPAASLPLIAGVLASFFELDNTGEKEGEGDKKDTKAEAKTSGKRVQVADKDEEEDEEEEEAAGAKKRR